jgi:hypothetical protein
MPAENIFALIGIPVPKTVVVNERAAPLASNAPYHEAGRGGEPSGRWIPRSNERAVFDEKDAFEGKDVCVVFPETLDACPARAADCRQSRADRFVYLRAAQAYMLISMPTGSSTIFGVFQLIRVSQVVWHDGRAGFERRSGADATQVRWTGIRTTLCRA